MLGGDARCKRGVFPQVKSEAASLQDIGMYGCIADVGVSRGMYERGSKGGRGFGWLRAARQPGGAAQLPRLAARRARAHVTPHRYKPRAARARARHKKARRARGGAATWCAWPARRAGHARHVAARAPRAISRAHGASGGGAPRAAPRRRRRRRRAQSNDGASARRRRRRRRRRRPRAAVRAARAAPAGRAAARRAAAGRRRRRRRRRARAVRVGAARGAARGAAAAALAGARAARAAPHGGEPAQDSNGEPRQRAVEQGPAALGRDAAQDRGEHAQGHAQAGDAAAAAAARHGAPPLGGDQDEDPPHVAAGARVGGRRAAAAAAAAAAARAPPPAAVCIDASFPRAVDDDRRYVVRAGRALSDATKAKLSQRIKQMWADPQYRARVARGVEQRRQALAAARAEQYQLRPNCADASRPAAQHAAKRAKLEHSRRRKRVAEAPHAETPDHAQPPSERDILLRADDLDGITMQDLGITDAHQEGIVLDPFLHLAPEQPPPTYASDQLQASPPCSPTCAPPNGQHAHAQAAPPLDLDWLLDLSADLAVANEQPTAAATPPSAEEQLLRNIPHVVDNSVEVRLAPDFAHTAAVAAAASASLSEQPLELCALQGAEQVDENDFLNGAESLSVSRRADVASSSKPVFKLPVEDHLPRPPFF
ncbi:Basic-leucine zipper [Gracilaria domingensis]|nr:Basic-leucine zipper [Gracilaria domingensis]